ncbi:shikimate kinase [Streptomyces sp. 6N223]|uniref:shikimate kinase n=1 Tax=Streptomyces sp. 6N223 TaxID=3457412 RepID=UPI003FCF4DB3
MTGATGPAVILVGPPGSGKSTVGALLAARLGLTLRDTDADIERTTGRTIPEIFVDDGEARFRELEAAAVREAVTTHHGVVSLGGGAITNAGTRALLTGLPVVFLDVALGEAIKRVGLDTARPLLAVNPRQQWRSLMEARRPLYTEVARATVHTEERTPEEVAEAILDALELKTA